ncbi:MAG TPA: HupE/UreJ family protein [Vicinamibacterales bacterium]|nr:HupE/UreJ family protein [Vicinamibacterales bacterium]
MRRGVVLALACLAAAVPAAHAHPSPFSYLDVRLEASSGGPAGSRLEGRVVVHVYDLAHDLHVDAARLADPPFLAAWREAIIALLDSRSAVLLDGRPLTRQWHLPEPLLDRQSVSVRFSAEGIRGAAVVGVRARLFPYDPAHQTFVNIYEDGALRLQAILDARNAERRHFTGTRQGRLALVVRFARSGIHHILIGPDHLLFLVGLLLLGGSLRRLIQIVTAFTLAHSATLSLAALAIVSPPSRLVEPAIALSIIYVGADNLLIGRGRDVRAWIAFTFGLVHGFAFAGVLGEMGLPRSAIGWSLLAFNVGVEIGQLFVVVAVAAALGALRRHNEAASRRIAFGGSTVVIAAGAFWFVQRVFFGGGPS